MTKPIKSKFLFKTFILPIIFATIITMSLSIIFLYHDTHRYLRHIEDKKVRALVDAMNFFIQTDDNSVLLEGANILSKNHDIMAFYIAEGKDEPIISISRDGKMNQKMLRFMPDKKLLSLIRKAIDQKKTVRFLSRNDNSYTYIFPVESAQHKDSLLTIIV